MKMTKTTLLGTTLLSAILMGQTAVASQAPIEVQVFKDHDNSTLYPLASHKPRVNYSIVDADVNDHNEWTELFPESER